MLAGGGGSSSGSINARADDKGDFVLEGLGPDSTVTITARLRDRRSKEPIKVRAGGPAPVTVASRSVDPETVELPQMRQIPYIRAPIHEQSLVPQLF